MRSDSILSGIRVLDFTRVLAGPFASRILGDFGAEVLKVQSKKIVTGTEANASRFFKTWNRNKHSITLDLERPEARALVFKLAAKSDVVIENFSPRVMSNWGLNYKRLRKAKGDLIMVSLSAMGQTGPWRNFVAFAPTIHALSGLTYLTSVAPHFWDLRYPYSDIIAGLYAAFGVLAALNERDITGKGRYLDLSHFESLLTCLGPAFLDKDCNGKGISRPSPSGCYPCLGFDRWCVLTVCNEEEWRALGNVLGNPRWTREERFATEAKRRRHGRALDQKIASWTRKHTAEEVVRLLQTAGIAAGVVQDAHDLVEDPHLKQRRFWKTREDLARGRFIWGGSPITSQGLKMNCKPSPSLGEANEFVFKEILGLTNAKYEDYVRRGIIC